jgi:cytidine deaminase
MNPTKLSQFPTALVLAARHSQNNAYAPYSNFKVGAAIQADNGKTYSCCNVENAAYPLGQCAEAGAISSMIADGGKQIIELVIVGSNNEFCFPCGGCRQKLAEFSTPNTLIKLVTQDNQVHVTKVAELLPNAFNLTTDG